jgi:hypothetical protein
MSEEEVPDSRSFGRTTCKPIHQYPPTLMPCCTYLHLTIGLDIPKEPGKDESRDIRQSPTKPKEGQSDLQLCRFENRQNQSKRRWDLGRQHHLLYLWTQEKRSKDSRWLRQRYR